MEDIKNITKEEVLEIIKAFPITPLRNRLIITVNVDEEEDGLVLTNTSFSESQYVVSTGTFIKDVKVGDKVILDLDKMVETVADDHNPYEKVSRIKIDPIEVDGKIYAMVYDSVIKAIDKR